MSTWKRRLAWPLACALALTPTSVVASAAPAPAQPSEVINEARGRALAVSTGKPVEVTALTTETARVFANPGGTLTMTQSVLPERVRRGNGWVPVDTTLRRTNDGTVAPVASTLDVAFSAGGDARLLRLRRDGRELRLDWPARLPAPTLRGDEATYADVQPGVDLVLRATVESVSQVLVVKTPQAAAGLSRIRLGVTTDGLTVRDDGKSLAAVDPTGKAVFESPAAYMWDSSDSRASAARPGGRVATVDTAVEGSTLELVPDRNLVENGKFPLYIDPAWTGARQAWTQVWSNYPTTSFYNGANLGSSENVARVGYDGEDQKRTRSFFRFDTSGVNKKRIVKATLQTYEVWSWSCTAREVQVWETTGIGSGTTWNNQPTWITTLDKKSLAKGFSSSCPSGGVEFNVTAHVVKAAANSWDSITQGMKASATAESNRDAYSWKKFRNNPNLTIEYNTVPSVPTALSTDGSALCTTGSGRLVIPSTGPTLRATVADPDNAVKARFEWWTASGTAPVGTYVSPTLAGKVPTVAAAPIPQGAFPNGSIAKWRVRGEDGTDVSGWSAWCEFAVDTSKPPNPTLTSTGFPDNGPGNAVMGVSLPVTFGAGGNPDVAYYEYTLNADQAALNARATGVSATVNLVPDRFVNWIHARSVDRAGNRSGLVTVVFYAAEPSGAVADWRLDETGDGTKAVDSAGGGFDATLGGAASWADGRFGGALTLDGATGYAATTGSVIDTTQSFAVSAWVRPASLNQTMAIAMQGGVHVNNFMLAYNHTDRRWTFSRANADVLTTAFARAVSTTVPVADGHWTHLVGVHDANARQIRLYVNGVLEASSAYTTPWNGSRPVQLGRFFTGGGSSYWHGDLDAVTIHNRILLNGEFQQVARLSGRWKLDESSGATAADSGGTHPAVWSATGVTRVAGRTGNAVQLDGLAGTLTASGPAVRTDGSYSLTMWVKPTAVPRQEVVLSQMGSTVGAFAVCYMWIPSVNGMRWAFTAAQGDSLTVGADWATDLFDAPIVGEWTMLAAVYDAKDRRIRFYLNGQFVAEAHHAGAWNATGALKIGTGRRPGTAGPEFFTGVVDDVHMYSGVLTDQEIFGVYTGETL